MTFPNITLKKLSGLFILLLIIGDDAFQTETKYTPSWMQKYHSPWYLSPKIWTTKLPPEGLQDPKENKEQQMTESKKKSKSLVGFKVDHFPSLVLISRMNQSKKKVEGRH